MRTSFASSSERQVGDCLTPKNGSAEKKAICPHLFHCSAPLIAALPHCPLLRQLVKRISKQGSSLSATSHFPPERNRPGSASSNPPTRAILSSELAQSQWLEWRPHAEGGWAPTPWGSIRSKAKEGGLEETSGVQMLFARKLLSILGKRGLEVAVSGSDAGGRVGWARRLGE